MLIVVKFISSIILSIGYGLAIANIEHRKFTFGKRQILSLLVLGISTFIIIEIEFSLIKSLLIYVITIFAYKEMFELDIKKAIIIVSIVMIVSFFVDASGVLLTMSFVAKETYRTSAFWLLFCNLYLLVVLYIVTKIPMVSNKLNLFVNKASSNKIFTIISETVLIVILFFLVSYNIYRNLEFSWSYLINILIYVLVGIVLFIYIKETNEYNRLLDEYDKVIEYVQTFEEWIEDEQIELHESKNSLSAIYEMTDIKEVRQEIDKILNRKGSLEDRWVLDLKPIPKGGLKGLLYYKFMIIKNSKLNLITDVSNQVTNKLKRLNKNDIKLLLRLIGIYFDNAIESALESKKKNISFEVYKIKTEIHIVITNTYKDKIDINKIGKRGVSTKGPKRGHGTYLAQKLVSKNNKFRIDNAVINNYYIQKIVIN